MPMMSEFLVRFYFVHENSLFNSRNVSFEYNESNSFHLYVVCKRVGLLYITKSPAFVAFYNNIQ